MTETTEPQNLWSSLLKESSKRFKAPEATCVFLGDIDIGKKTLFKKIVGNSTIDDDGADRVIKDIVSYTFIDVEEGMLDSDSLSRINLWSISNKTFEGCLDQVIQSGKSERLLFMIGIDISKPESCREDLKRWLIKMRKFATNRNASTAGTGTNLEWSELGLNIIIVACKSDLVKVDDAANLKRAKAIQGELRAIGLLIGAAVVYVSAVTETNTARLRKYIINRLYPEAFRIEGGIEDGTASAFIPHDSDSAELIHIATGHSTNSATGVAAAQLLDAPDIVEDEEVKAVAVPGSSLEPEDEEDWLTGLQNFINDVTSTGIGGVPQGVLPASPSLSVVVDATAVETVKSSTRRTFRTPVAAQGKQDVDDFFQKLLIGEGPSAAKK